jgi:uncharacterized membrane-anchored protein YhcB (DUF1043 family)
VNTRKNRTLAQAKREVLRDIESDLSTVNDRLNETKDMEVKIHYARLADLLEHTAQVIKSTKELV